MKDDEHVNFLYKQIVMIWSKHDFAWNESREEHNQWMDQINSSATNNLESRIFFIATGISWNSHKWSVEINWVKQKKTQILILEKLAPIPTVEYIKEREVFA